MSLGSSIDEFVDVVKTAAKGENILHSNKAINESIFSNFTGAVESSFASILQYGDVEESTKIEMVMQT